jgi:Sybindin-like family
MYLGYLLINVTLFCVLFVCVCVCVVPRWCCFAFVCSPEVSTMSQQLRALYQHYSDYCLKNPLHTPNEPIECELFTSHVQALFAPYAR